MKNSTIRCTNLFILCLTILSLSTTAQVPGYAGKKLAITANVDGSLALYDRLRLDWIDTNPIGPAIGINKRFGVGMEYTVSREITLGVALKHANILYPWIYVSKTTFTPPYFYNEIAYYGDVIVATNYLSCYVKKFSFLNHGHIAPIGNYHKFGFSIIKGHPENGPEHETNLEAFETVSLEEDVNIVTSFDEVGYAFDVPVGLISYAYGGQHVIFNRVLIGCEMEFSLPVTGNVYAEEYNLNLNYFEDSFSHSLAKRIYTASWLVVNLQIGLFPF